MNRYYQCRREDASFPLTFLALSPFLFVHLSFAFCLSLYSPLVPFISQFVSCVLRYRCCCLRRRHHYHYYHPRYRCHRHHYRRRHHRHPSCCVVYFESKVFASASYVYTLTFMCVNVRATVRYCVCTRRKG